MFVEEEEEYDVILENGQQILCNALRTAIASSSVSTERGGCEKVEGRAEEEEEEVPLTGMVPVPPTEEDEDVLPPLPPPDDVALSGDNVGTTG